MTIEKWFPAPDWSDHLLILAVINHLRLFLLLGAVVAIILSPLETRLRKLVKHSKISAGIMTFAVLLLVFIHCSCCSS